MHNLTQLKVWVKAIDLCTEVYDGLATFPSDEKFGLSSQIKRSVVSIASNIAEGAGRNSRKEFIYFLGIAKGSSYELQTQIIIAKRLRLMEEDRANLLCDQIVEVQKMIFGFLSKLNKENITI